MHYDRFLDIFLCTSKKPTGSAEKLKKYRAVRDGYYFDKVDPSAYIAARSKRTKTGALESIHLDQQEISKVNADGLTWSLAGNRGMGFGTIKTTTKYVACYLDINYVNGSIDNAARPIPQLEMLMDWICEKTIVSKLMIAGHGSGVADGGIYCGGYEATADQLATSLELNGLRKGPSPRDRPTAKPGAKWKNDRSSDRCYCCQGQIRKGVFVSNKHHCRRCGEIVDDGCSRTRMELEEALTEKSGLQPNTGRVRVCNTCVNEIRNPAPFNPKTSLNFVKGLRQINIMSCGAAASTDARAMPVFASNHSFAVQSFAENFTKSLTAKKIRGVRIAAANESVSFARGDQKSATTIEIPKRGKPANWSISKDGIPNKTYGFDRSWADSKIQDARSLTGFQKPIDDRTFLIKVSPNRSELYFGLLSSERMVKKITEFFQTQWKFPQWTVADINVAEGIFGMMPASAALAPPMAAGNRAQNRQTVPANIRARNSMGGQMGSQAIAWMRTLRLTPPPGYNLRFEELIDSIKLIGGRTEVSWIDVKVVSMS